jgi:hypothetical protein
LCSLPGSYVHKSDPALLAKLSFPPCSPPEMNSERKQLGPISRLRQHRVKSFFTM